MPYRIIQARNTSGDPVFSWFGSIVAGPNCPGDEPLPSYRSGPNLEENRYRVIAPLADSDQRAVSPAGASAGFFA